MKALRIRRAAPAAIALLALFAVGCGTLMGGGGGQNIPLTNSARVPAATGEVQTKIDNDGNTSFNVKVDHLAPPDRVQSGAQTYVVWVHPMGGNQGPQNVGALAVDRDSLKGNFSGLTPHRRFQLSITAESDITAQSPQGPALLSAQVFQYEKRR